MSSIKLKHSGGNSVSLNPPTSAPTSSDVAFKLPNADGNANQLLKTDGSGNLGWATNQGGKILQYKYVQSGNTIETSQTTYQNLSATFSVTITPTSANNLLLARFTFHGTVWQNNGGDASGLVSLTDDDASSYLLEQRIRSYDYGLDGTFQEGPYSFEHVKVAGNTNARTYSIRYRKISGGKIIINNAGDRNSVLSVMEIEP